ncbi:MAG: hypothetical protein P4L84_08060 [Isosphaeraceae bacterium]|nr:hypothetical protein [Isosphaeraceae bacterium]
MNRDRRRLVRRDASLPGFGLRRGDTQCPVNATMIQDTVWTR